MINIEIFFHRDRNIFIIVKLFHWLNSFSSPSCCVSFRGSVCVAVSWFCGSPIFRHFRVVLFFLGSPWVSWLSLFAVWPAWLQFLFVTYSCMEIVLIPMLFFFSCASKHDAHETCFDTYRVSILFVIYFGILIFMDLLIVNPYSTSPKCPFPIFEIDWLRTIDAFMFFFFHDWMTTRIHIIPFDWDWWVTYLNRAKNETQSKNERSSFGCYYYYYSCTWGLPPNRV